MASGSTGAGVQYRSTRNGAVATSYRTPTCPRSPAQIGTQSMMGFLMRLWPALTVNQQATWSALAELDKHSPFNAFLRLNMRRWTNNDGPCVSNATPPSAAYSPTIAATATAVGNRATISIAPATIPQHVNVTAGTPAPNPNCIGRYDYLEQHNAKNAYRRAGASPNRLFYDSTDYTYLINNTDNYTTTPRWISWLSTPDGTYNGSAGNTGQAISSANIPAAPDAPAEAVAIYRHTAAITLPNRRLCIAVLDLDAAGQVTHQDPNLAPATYYYLAVPLSLDGRMGTPAAAAPLVVS